MLQADKQDKDFCDRVCHTRIYMLMLATTNVEDDAAPWIQIHYSITQAACSCGSDRSA
jgi:hypothetical protein